MENARTHSGVRITFWALSTVYESGLLWISCCIPSAVERITFRANKLNSWLTFIVLCPVKWAAGLIRWSQVAQFAGTTKAVARESSRNSFPKLLRPLRFSYFYFVSTPAPRVGGRGGGGTFPQYLYSWFRTGYPFSGRFLEWGIIFRTYESSSN